MKNLRLISSGVFVVSFLLMVAARQYYTFHMPKAVVPALGRTEPIEVNHGSIVYVSNFERELLYATYVFFGISLILFAVSAVLEPGRK